jgi:class 3 adenylate cyclase
MGDLRHELYQWLDGIGLAQYADLLAAHDIDRDILSLLSDADFDRLGISLGHRRLLLKAAAERQHSASERLDKLQGFVRSTDIKAERRHLTVLFCDIAGSTKLSTQLDPEELAGVLREFQSCCGEAIRQYDGHFARFMGDGVLAYFGFPRAHEDDGERAVNAALKMMASIAASHSGAAHGIKVRIGIATGLVIVGDLVGEGPAVEFALVGEAPNLAARLQQLARPNQILASSGTRRLLGSRFVLEDAGERTLDGFDRPVRIWSVVKSNAIESRFEARQAAPLTRFVGRGRELALLHDCYRAAGQGDGRVVLISGEPGIGKSRLVMALVQELTGNSGSVLLFQCSPYHTSSAWHPVVRHLEDAAGIDPEQPPALRLRKLETLVEQRLAGGRKDFVPVLAALLNVPTGGRHARLELAPPQLKARTFEALLTLFRAHAGENAGERPAIFVFEDVHWIDPTSLELLERLRDDAGSRQMLVLVLTRPELALPWTDRPHVVGLALNRLHKEEVAAIVEALSGEEPLSPGTVDQIAAKTDGVPLFVEEMTKAVLETIDRSAAGPGGGPHAAPSLPVPDTLHESLMARLDQLNPVKAIAQTASVIGREFRLDLLEAIAGQPRRDVHAAVDRLLASGLLYRSGLPGDQHFTFKHTLVQEEAYASLLNTERRALHGRIAAALRETFVSIAERVPEVVAHHHTQAGETRPAIDCWLTAGRQASERSAFIEASTHFRTALDLAAALPAVPDRDELELRLQYSLGSALAAWKGFAAPETEQVFTRALDLCNRLEPSAQSLAVLNGVIGIHVARGEFEQVRALAEQLLARARRQADLNQADPTVRLMGHRALGSSLFVIGELPAARAELQNTIDLYDVNLHAPLPLTFSNDPKITSLSYMGLAAALQHDIHRAVAHGHEAVAHGERLQHPPSIGMALSFLAGAHLLLRDPDSALPIADRCLAMAQEHGFTQWIAGGQMLRGWAHLERGDARQALADIRGSIETMEQTGALLWIQFSRYLLTAALLAAGELDEAEGVVNHELSRLAGTSGRWYGAELHRIDGRLREARGDAAAARVCYGVAIALAERQGALLWQLRAATDLAVLLRGGSGSADGGSDEACERLARLCASLGDGITSKDALAARAVLADAQGA